MTRRRQSEPTSLRELLTTLRTRKRWEARLEGARVHEHWEAIAGAQLARHTQPVRLHGGVLVCRADSAVWATQVRFLSGELAMRANEVLGEGQVTQVHVVTGSPSSPHAPP